MSVKTEKEGERGREREIAKRIIMFKHTHE